MLQNAGFGTPIAGETRANVLLDGKIIRDYKVSSSNESSCICFVGQDGSLVINVVGLGSSEIVIEYKDMKAIFSCFSGTEEEFASFN